MNTLFDDEIRGHHSMRDLVLRTVDDSDLEFRMSGTNPSLGELLVQLGAVEGVYTRSFSTGELDWTHVQVPPPHPVTVANLASYFREEDEAMEAALNAYSDDELQVDRIVRGEDFVVSAFVQHQIHREAVYIFYGKLSVYLRALGRDAGPEWAAWVD